MRKIKFRGKRLDNGQWVYGGKFSYPIYDIQIIGNIYDNPELLKTE